MKQKFILIFLFIIWSALCWYHYVAKIKGFKIFADVKAKTKAVVSTKTPTQDIETDQEFEKDSIFRIIIEFEKNEVKPTFNKINDSLLNTAFDYCSRTGKNLFIKGFAASENMAVENYKLGRIRAWVIKNKLLQKGIKSEKLITSAENNKGINIVEITSEK